MKITPLLLATLALADASTSNLRPTEEETANLRIYHLHFESRNNVSNSIQVGTQDNATSFLAGSKLKKSTEYGGQGENDRLIPSGSELEKSTKGDNQDKEGLVPSGSESEKSENGGQDEEDENLVSSRFELARPIEGGDENKGEGSTSANSEDDKESGQYETEVLTPPDSEELLSTGPKLPSLRGLCPKMSKRNVTAGIVLATGIAIGAELHYHPDGALSTALTSGYGAAMETAGACRDYCAETLTLSLAAAKDYFSLTEPGQCPAGMIFDGNACVLAGDEGVCEVPDEGMCEVPDGGMCEVPGEGTCGLPDEGACEVPNDGTCGLPDEGTSNIAAEGTGNAATEGVGNIA
ncbi:hypothetical protein PSACC_03173, partial [Paramicrosporidium saccamoebae]